MSESVDDFLAHHGVKGMKWGVRKERPSASFQPPSKAKKTSSESMTRSEAAKKFIANNRLANLSSAQKKKIVIGAGISGAAAVASMVAGPLGGLSVSVIGRTLHQSFDVTDS